jgi:hypothetical protein
MFSAVSKMNNKENISTVTCELNKEIARSTFYISSEYGQRFSHCTRSRE